MAISIAHLITEHNGPIASNALTLVSSQNVPKPKRPRVYDQNVPRSVGQNVAKQNVPAAVPT